jgi:hypothetical protein
MSNLKAPQRRRTPKRCRDWESTFSYQESYPPRSDISALGRATVAFERISE